MFGICVVFAPHNFLKTPISQIMEYLNQFAAMFAYLLDSLFCQKKP